MPEDVKLAMALVIADQIEAHIHSFGVFLLDGFIDDPTGHVVICLHGC